MTDAQPHPSVFDDEPLEDDMPLDPDTHEYSDDEEGADQLGLPVTSVYGSEERDAVPPT
jgi:hypothetical protein